MTWPDPNTVSGCHNCAMCPWHLKCSVPRHYLKLSAPGTITVFTALLSASCQVDSGVTSLSRFPAHLWDDLGTSCLAVGFLLVFTSPLGMEWILATQATVSPAIDWAESSCPPMVCDGSMHCLMLACRLHCKSCTFTVVLFLREINFHTTSHISCWPVNMC